MNLFNGNQLFLLEEIVKRNFAAKYKGSSLGIFWSVLQPLLIMILLTIIFSTIFGHNIDNYPVYYLSGRCIFTFFTSSVSVTMMAIRGNQPILKKTAAPKYIFVLGGVISEFINFLISIMILIAVMIVTSAPFHFKIIPLSIIPVISTIIMVTGIGFILSILCTYYSDVQHLWSVVNMALMYASALFFPMEIIPEPYQHYLLLNPLYWAINQFRKTAVQGIIPDSLNMINLILISIIILIFGIIVFKKYEHKVTMKF